MQMEETYAFFYIDDVPPRPSRPLMPSNKIRHFDISNSKQASLHRLTELTGETGWSDVSSCG